MWKLESRNADDKPLGTGDFPVAPGGLVAGVTLNDENEARELLSSWMKSTSTFGAKMVITLWHLADEWECVETHRKET